MEQRGRAYRRDHRNRAIRRKNVKGSDPFTEKTVASKKAANR